MTRRARLGGVLCVLGSLAPGLSTAHAVLVRSLPGADASLGNPPEAIEVWFNEGVGEDYKALAVIDGQGTRVDKQDARLGFFDSAYLRVSVPPLAPGVYTVRYRVQSADGRIVNGKFNFSVARP
jgi:methionine-rich copper-binding protein CopC